MPISFSCGQCKKDYVVSDGLAGKRAVCKSCGNRMTIPGEGVSGATAAVSSPARPVHSQQAASPSRTADVYEPSADELYGFGESPSTLPPVVPRSRLGSEAPEQVVPSKHKKKKKGFFSSVRKQKSSGGSFQLTGVGNVGGWIVGFVIISIISGVAGFGLISKGDVERFHTTLIQQRADLLSVLKTVKDASSAKAASSRARDLVTKMTALLEVEGHKKGRVNDVKELNQRYATKHQTDVQAIIREFTRIAMIPGAIEGLNIEAEMNNLDRVEKSLQAAAAKQGVN